MDNAPVGPPPANDARVFVDNVRGLLSQISPPQRIVIKDYRGKEYVLPGALPARRQASLFRELLKLGDLEAIKALEGHLDNLTIASGLQLLFQAALDEAVAEQLGKAFQVAHPALFDDPLDDLAMEELLAGLIPYVLRFLKRTGMALIGVGETVLQGAPS